MFAFWSLNRPFTFFYGVPGTVPGARDTVVSKTKFSSDYTVATFQTMIFFLTSVSK